MKYKVLSFDLDGTLTDSEKKITPRTKAAVTAAINEGSMIVLASGRPPYGIMPVVRQLALNEGFILAYNGGAIIDLSSNAVIYEQKIPNAYIKDICNYANDRDFGLLTYEGDCVITNQKDNPYVCEEANINHLPIKQIDNLAEYIDFPVNKFIIAEDPAIVETEIPKLRKIFPELNVFSSAAFFLEIVPPDIDKAYSLEFLLERLKLDRTQLAAFGDGGNDVGMLKYAGMGVAMSNACVTCKNAADYVTLSNDEDGCAAAIEKMLSGEL